MKILIVEDEQELNALLSENFKKIGAMCLSAGNKFEAEDQVLKHQFDCIILDISLPDGSGLDLIPIIKSNQNNAGLLIVSAKNSLEDKIKGLDLGADDYITKPFHFAELNSRLNALIRRKDYNGKEVLKFNEITINIDENQVYINENPLILTKKEFLLLNFFIINKDRILTKETIAEHLWGEDIAFLENYDFIYTHIKNLRKKIEILGGKDYLKTVHGIGYKYASS